MCDFCQAKGVQDTLRDHLGLSDLMLGQCAYVCGGEMVDDRFLKEKTF